MKRDIHTYSLSHTHMLIKEKKIDKSKPYALTPHEIVKTAS